jgi:hypothetical protein
MMYNGDSEVDRNYDAFVAELPRLLLNFQGKFALLHKQAVVDLFDSAVQAITEGCRKFGDGDYSVQQVIAEPEHLGFYSYAGGAGQA